MQSNKSFYLTLVILGFTAFASTEGSSLDDSCTEPGLTQHPYDRHKFLICSDKGEGRYRADDYPCAPGHIFSVEELTCIPSRQIRPKDGTPKDGGPDPPKDDPMCHKKSLTCADYSTYLICAEVSEGIWNQVANGTCASLGMKCCGGVNDYCTSDPTACKNFTCSADGVYPDPEDCTGYFNCSGGKSTSLSCPVGQVTTTCPNDYLLSCHKPSGIDDCREIHCAGVSNFPSFMVYDCPTEDKLKSNIYYIICLSKTKYVASKCLKDHHFDTNKKQCVKNST